MSHPEQSWQKLEAIAEAAGIETDTISGEVGEFRLSLTVSDGKLTVVESLRSGEDYHCYLRDLDTGEITVAQARNRTFPLVALGNAATMGNFPSAKWQV